LKMEILAMNLDKHRDQYDCGNSLYDYITGGPEYVRWKRRRDRIDLLFYIGSATIIGILLGAYMLHNMTEPEGAFFYLVFGLE
jgi:hypothetical protein